MPYLDPDAILLPEKLWNDVNEVSISALFADVVQPRWLGNLGKAWYAEEAKAQKMSDTAIGTLHHGIYQLVQTKAASTAAPARGIPCFWDTFANTATNLASQTYTVTPDAGAALDGFYAGVYISAPTKGNFCIIQVSGLCTIKYRATVTDTTAGDLVQLVTATNTFDALGDAVAAINAGGGNTTTMGFKNVRGIAYQAPTNAGLLQAIINPPWIQNFKMM